MNNKSSKTRKDYLKEDLLNDPYLEPTLSDIMAEDNSQDYVDAIRETKEKRNESKRYFDSLRRKLERN